MTRGPLTNAITAAAERFRTWYVARGPKKGWYHDARGSAAGPFPSWLAAIRDGTGGTRNENVVG